MKKLIALFAGLSSCLLLASCASNPYGTGKNQGYFLGPATVSSNVVNICKDSNAQYAFKGTQSWLAGGQGTSWYTCTPSRKVNYSPQYILSYSIIKNDGTGKNVVANCTPKYSGSSKQFSQINLVVQLNSGNPTCQAILS
jgi:hypothetical protein